MIQSGRDIRELLGVGNVYFVPGIVEDTGILLYNCSKLCMFIYMFEFIMIICVHVYMSCSIQNIDKFWL